MTAQELKNSILQLAVQGKLVPQHSTDEPVSELLKRIQTEKARLIKEGKIKKEKALPPIAEEELPFDIPESWIWVRLGEYMDVRDGTHDSPKYVVNGFPLVTSKNLKNGLVDMENVKYITRADYDSINERSRVDTGDILFAMIGSIGNPSIVGENHEYAIKNVALLKKVCSEVCEQYIYYYMLLSQYTMKKIASGGVQPFVSLNFLRSYLMPLPPIEEQQRIVEKIEELLPLVEEYGKAETRLKELNADFPDMLRKSILQQAVQGKLTERNPEDEPASELLKRIQAEKAQLIKDGKLKKEKPLPPITEDEIPFDIPESWVWVRLGDLANKLTDGTHKTPIYVKTGVPFVSVKDMSSGVLDLSRTKYITKKEHDELCLRCKPEYGDLLISKVGTTGVPAIVKTYTEFSLFVSVALMKFSQNLLDVEYLYYLIYTPLVNGQVKENTKGIGNKNWVIDKIKETLVVLPPLEEQKRIVARVEELLALCDQLK